MAETELQRIVKGQRAIGLKGEHWDNYAVAKYTLDGELGRHGQTAQHVHDFDQFEVNTLLVNGRQDIAHALCNTKSLLDLNGRISRQLRFTNVLLFFSVCFLGMIVYKLYPQIMSGLHLE